MESIYKSRKFEVVRRQVMADGGQTRTIDFVLHPGAVVILPLLSEVECVMIRNWRHVLDGELWELPAGTLDVEGESPEKAAIRELEEETGYRTAKVDKLCEFYPSPGVMNELIHAFVARDLEQSVQKLEPSERIVVESMKLVDAIKMIREGRIVDAKTIITLMSWCWPMRKAL